MKCPHCQVEVNPNFTEKYIGEYGLYYSINYMRCPNPVCRMPIIHLSIADSVSNYPSSGLTVKDYIRETKQLFPIGSNRAPAALEVESRFAEDYNEACLVLPFSPKASAALSRRCLQNIIRLKEGIKERNLKTEIDKLIATGKLPSYITDNLEIIRGFGDRKSVV